MRAIFSKHLLANFILLLLPIILMAQGVVSIHVDATINPAVASFIRSSIEKAKKEKAWGSWKNEDHVSFQPAILGFEHFDGKGIQLPLLWKEF